MPRTTRSRETCPADCSGTRPPPRGGAPDAGAADEPDAFVAAKEAPEGEAPAPLRPTARERNVPQPGSEGNRAGRAGSAGATPPARPFSRPARADALRDALPLARQDGPDVPTLVERLPSTPLAVRDTLATVCRAVARLGLHAEDSATLELVLAEALNNIVEHAYRGEPSGWIVVEVDLARTWIACRILDGGRPMPNGELPRPRSSDLSGPLDSLPEGGFGWNLIHKLTRTLAYSREDACNCLLFALARSVEAGGQPAPPHAHG